MKTVLRHHYEKFLAAVFAAMFAVSFLWAWSDRPPNPIPVRSRPQTAAAARAPEVASGPTKLEVASPWAEPADQGAGPGWRFELFTPPAIHYRKPTNSFVVDPPANLAPADPPPEDFGVELVAVRPEPYRLQLVGYFGVPGNYTGMFTSPRLPATLLGRPGRRFAELGLKIEEIEVARAEPGRGGSTSPEPLAARAVIADEESGREVLLDSRTPAYTGGLIATLCRRADGTPHELRAGEEWSCGQTNYRVARLQLDPAEAVVTRHRTDEDSSETRALHPAFRTSGPPRPRRSPEEVEVAAQDSSDANPSER